MKTTAAISNLIFMAINRLAYSSMLKACNNPESEQLKVLLAIISKNSESDFGTEHTFKRINSVYEFQNNVPISSYDDYTTQLARIMMGGKHVLCNEEIYYLALSSGSGSASKYVPYTNSLKNEFNKAINPWIYDLLKNHKGVKYGTQFWIITPSTLPAKLPFSKVPIGFEQDLHYFGRMGKILLQSVMCLPINLNHISDNSNYFYLISYCLLKDKYLRLISVWNPGLLLIIFRFIRNNFDQLCDDLKKGTVQLPNNEIQQDQEIAVSCMSKDDRRGNYLANLKEFNTATIKQIWPKLEVISCWTDAWAGIYMEEINTLFPGIKIQGKGLLATEGVVSIPIKDLPFPLLTIQSHFYEFRNLNDNKIYLAHELKIDEKYELILTTSGGLYRYLLNDIVKIKGHFRKTPLLEFIGKRDIISDMCGEKLHEDFIAEVLKLISEKYLSKQTLMFLAPFKSHDSFYYILYLEAGEEVIKIDFQKLVLNLDNELMLNYHYRHCRKMHQLNNPKLKLIDHNGALKYLALKNGKNISSTGKINYLFNTLLDPSEFEGPIY